MKQLKKEIDKYKQSVVQLQPKGVLVWIKK